jgi:hypothetical protein
LGPRLERAGDGGVDGASADGGDADLSESGTDDSGPSPIDGAAGDTPVYLTTASRRGAAGRVRGELARVGGVAGVAAEATEAGQRVARGAGGAVWRRMCSTCDHRMRIRSQRPL